MPYAANQLGKERLAEWEKHYKEMPRSKNNGHACISHLRGYTCSWHYNREEGWKQYHYKGANPQHGRYNPDIRHALPAIIIDPRPCNFPLADHSTLWKDRETGELVYVTQPYGSTNEPEKDFLDKDLENMTAFCKEYGLKMKIDPSLGWHYPRGCTCIVVTRDPDSTVPFGRASGYRSDQTTTRNTEKQPLIV